MTTTYEAPTGTQKSALAKLREPFDAVEVGKLPKPHNKDAPKGSCQECGKWHGLPAVHLDYVGHGYLTKRLLDVDPLWFWEPMAVSPDGLPLLDRDGNLWIRLHVAGMSRLGVGDGATMKIRVGDALRNAAMRFGAALDLWCKGSEDEHDGDTTGPQAAPGASLAHRLGAAIADLPESDKAAIRAYVESMGFPTKPAEWTDGQAATIERYLHSMPDPEPETVDPDLICTAASPTDPDLPCEEPVVFVDDDGKPWCAGHRPK